MKILWKPALIRRWPLQVHEKSAPFLQICFFPPSFSIWEVTGWSFPDLNCKFLHLIIHVLSSPTHAARRKIPKRIIIQLGSDFYLLRKLYDKMKTFGWDTIISVKSTAKTYQWYIMQRFLRSEHCNTCWLGEIHDGGCVRISSLLRKVIIKCFTVMVGSSC